MIRTVLLSLAALLVMLVSSSAQIAVHCCLPTWTPEQARENERFNREFDRAMANSKECQRMQIGCPDGYFTQSATDPNHTVYEVDQGVGKDRSTAKPWVTASANCAAHGKEWAEAVSPNDFWHQCGRRR